MCDGDCRVWLAGVLQAVTPHLQSPLTRTMRFSAVAATLALAPLALGAWTPALKLQSALEGPVHTAAKWKWTNCGQDLSFPCSFPSL